MPDELVEAISASYRRLEAQYGANCDVAVRSSATAEDLREASFAGQQETYLNIHGEAMLLDAVKRCYGSLFTDRAIVNRAHHGFDHTHVALSVGVQKMVRSDLACAGVMSSIDTEAGRDDPYCARRGNARHHLRRERSVVDGDEHGHQHRIRHRYGDRSRDPVDQGGVGT